MFNNFHVPIFGGQSISTLTRFFKGITQTFVQVVMNRKPSTLMTNISIPIRFLPCLVLPKSQMISNKTFITISKGLLSHSLDYSIPHLRSLSSIFQLFDTDSQFVHIYTKRLLYLDSGWNLKSGLVTWLPTTIGKKSCHGFIHFTSRHSDTL